MVARAGTRAGSRHTASWPLSPSRRLALSRGRGGRGGRRKGTEVVDTHPKNLSSLLLPHFSSIKQTQMLRIRDFLVICWSNVYVDGRPHFNDAHICACVLVVAVFLCVAPRTTCEEPDSTL